MRFTYTAKRSIASGHTLGNLYTLAIWPQELTPKDDPERVQNIANDGTEENLLFRIDLIYTITTDWISTPTPFDQWVEFIRSVMGGEQFDFDPDAYATAIAPVGAKLIPGTVTYPKVAPTYDARTIGFSLRLTDAIL